jgi:AraC-like DNA-binding protein
MKSAGKMLGESDFSVTEIALSLGYPDLYTFTKAFRKYYGSSPSVFRKDHKTN